jgi:hypothetical protein
MAKKKIFPFDGVKDDNTGGTVTFCWYNVTLWTSKNPNQPTIFKNEERTKSHLSYNDLVFNKVSKPRLV